MKKVIILWHNGGRLANQLWLYASVLSYCTENNYKLDNFSFFEYYKYFNLKPSNKFIYYLFFKPFVLFQPAKKVLNFLDKRLYNYIFKKCYLLYVFFISLFCKKSVIEAKHISSNLKICYLPPSDNSNQFFLDFDKKKSGRIFLKGWLFRNPLGIEKYREEIIEVLKPKDIYYNSAFDFVKPFKERFDNIIGVHIRKGDYRDIKNLYFSEEEVNIFLQELIKNFNFNLGKTCFVICSDEKVDKEVFNKDLNIIISDKNLVEDMLILSLCDKIIGSDSTFGSFAAYLGNKPIIVFDKNGIDWNYYIDKTKFFQNKKCTMSCF